MLRRSNRKRTRSLRWESAILTVLLACHRMDHHCVQASPYAFLLSSAIVTTPKSRFFGFFSSASKSNADPDPPPSPPLPTPDESILPGSGDDGGASDDDHEADNASDMEDQASDSELMNEMNDLLSPPPLPPMIGSGHEDDAPNEYTDPQHPSQPLQTLQKLQQMLDETDYLTSTRTPLTIKESPPQYPPAPPISAAAAVTTSTTTVQQRTLSQAAPTKPVAKPTNRREAVPGKLWTSKDRLKYKKQQQLLRIQQEEERKRSIHDRRRLAPPIYPHASDDEGVSDDTDDGLGYSLPNLPVYMSDAEDSEPEYEESNVNRHGSTSSSTPATSSNHRTVPNSHSQSRHNPNTVQPPPTPDMTSGYYNPYRPPEAPGSYPPPPHHYPSYGYNNYYPYAPPYGYNMPQTQQSAQSMPPPPYPYPYQPYAPRAMTHPYAATSSHYVPPSSDARQSRNASIASQKSGSTKEKSEKANAKKSKNASALVVSTQNSPTTPVYAMPPPSTFVPAPSMTLYEVCKKRLNTICGDTYSFLHICSCR
jgi:hypothetical protein